MSTGNHPVPAYNQACLATDSNRQQTSFYLAGSPRPGNLTVNYFNSFNAPDFDLIANKADQRAWDPNAQKLCFSNPNQNGVNAGVYVIQYGQGSTFVALAQTDNTVSNATVFGNIDFYSPKLSAWTGSFPEADMFLTATNSTYNGMTNMWAGIRLSYNNISVGLLQPVDINPPVDYAQALLAVGTYGSYSGNIAQGKAIVFDKNGGGRIHPTRSDLNSLLTNNLTLTMLSAPTSVIMSGIKLTESAIPVTMGSTAYILDKATNDSTVIYSINPTTSSTLVRVYISGDSLPFTNIKAASALYNGILTYSSNGATASFNVFDLDKKTWSGDGLVSAPVVEPPKSSTPIGAIIGGVVGGLVVIALAVFFLVRRHRLQVTQKKTAHDSDVAQQCLDPNKPIGADQDYTHYNPGYVQYEQGYVPYDEGLQHSPSFFPPPPPVNQGADEAYMYKVDGSMESKTSPYVSPTSYRDSISLPSKSPESVLATSARSSAIQDPQYVPNSTAAASDARSPQVVSTAYPVL